MKYVLILMFTFNLSINVVWANEDKKLENFHHDLIQGVSEDHQYNDHKFKKKDISRSPASTLSLSEQEAKRRKENHRLEKNNHNQLGTQKW